MDCHEFRTAADIVFDEGGHLSAEAERHHRACAACGQYVESQAVLVAALRDEAKRVSPSAPSGLTARVIDQVSASSAALAPVVPMRTRKTALIWAAAACVCVSVGVGLWMRDRDAQAQRDAAARQFREARTILASLGGASLSTESVSDAPPLWQGVVQVPLAREMDNLHADTIAAGRFIVDCLPFPVRKREG